MDLLRAVVYGIVQGVTEFLPISSSAHLRLTPVLFGWEDPGAAFTAVIQLGTVLALILYFAKDLGQAIVGWSKSLTGGPKDTPEARMGWAVFFGTLPIVVVGLALHDKIETTFRSLYIVAAGFIVMGLVMLYFDRNPGVRKVDDVQPKDGVFVGLWQCLALLPGMSRSGSTISGALALGFDRAAAARFSFLMSVPSITLAGLYEALKERKNLGGPLLMPTFVATIVSFFVGYAAIFWLMRFIQKRGISPFVLYRLVLGVVLLALMLTGHLDPNAGLPPATK